MKATIDLSEEGKEALHALARQFDFTDEQALDALVQICLVRTGPQHPDELGWRGIPDPYRALLRFVEDRFAEGQVPSIVSSPTVLGGDARVRNTRIPVWLLVAHKKWGQTDSEILAQYPSLNAADLSAAWDYYTAHTERVDDERRAHDSDG